ncbi:hypothetical protein [Eleftheria terrae]|uniref:hypothetical protein n=1 Tax=Eleftheria terrae TaxID=1597781 RepID=UPI00263A56A3|nr:hypothetical protein [Eleftheria terrae]WKB55001.1 hypothetical protein N7L95_11780 [Eleftheria terrae]
MKYTKTSQGAEVIKSRSMPLGPRLRTLLLLCDGQRSDTEVLATTQGMGASAADMQELLALGLIEAVGGTPRSIGTPAAASSTSRPAAGDPAPVTPAAGVPADRYQLAYRMATQFTSELGLRGFRLQLAVESAMNLKDLQDLAPRIKDALIAAHGPIKGADKAHEFEQVLSGG